MEIYVKLWEELICIDHVKLGPPIPSNIQLDTL